jgi:hypothetical protein
MTNDSVAIGIIGAGIMGERLLGAIVQQDPALVHACGIWDPSPDAMRRMERNFPKVERMPGAAAVIASGKGRAVAMMGDRLPAFPGVATMTEQGAVGGFYETRAFAAFAVPAATPKDIVKKLSDTLIEAGTDEKVKALMANYLIVGPLSFEETNKVFQRDTEIMLKVMKEIGIKAAE